MDSVLLEPTTIQLESEGVRIAWSDGREALFHYRPLRLICRCARCEDEMTGERQLDERSVPADVIVVEWLRIGRYALQFLWSDGHETGIYPYSMLLDVAESRKLLNLG